MALTLALRKSSLGNIEGHLSSELQAKMERAAAENKSGAEEHIKQLVEHYVDHDAWFR
jgi:hypothetical protein